MSFQVRRRVEFRDTDAAGIVHFSAFFPWMESAEHEMLRSVGIPVLPEDVHDGKSVTWPRVSASCDYSGAARFEDWIDIEVSIAEIGTSSVIYRFEFRKLMLDHDGESAPPKTIATGKIVSVCCRLLPGGRLEKATIPDITREKLLSLR